MNIEINKLFQKVLHHSLNTAQINYLGGMLDRTFDIYKESGFGTRIPLPQQTAAKTLLQYYSSDEDIVKLFTILLLNEGKRFYNANLNIWGREQMINLLNKFKWIYDEELIRFSMDPLYEHEINFLNKLRIIDLRNEIPVEKIIEEVKKASQALSIQELEWRISIRMYDMERSSDELIRKILDLLLVRQNLKDFTMPLFICLKELAINAVKANYKLIFGKKFQRDFGRITEENYYHFLRLFKAEIEENGNKRLWEMAKTFDKYITVTFQSTKEDIYIWVVNSDNISVIEKQRIIKKIKQGQINNKDLDVDNGDDAEGAGLGINLTLGILRKYSKEREPLKVIFYPEFIKIGFKLKREELKDVSPY